MSQTCKSQASGGYRRPQTGAHLPSLEGLRFGTLWKKHREAYKMIISLLLLTFRCDNSIRNADGNFTRIIPVFTKQFQPASEVYSGWTLLPANSSFLPNDGIPTLPRRDWLFNSLIEFTGVEKYRSLQTISHDYFLSSELSIKVYFLLPVSLKRSRLTVRCRTKVPALLAPANYVRYCILYLSACSHVSHAASSLPPRLFEPLRCWHRVKFAYSSSPCRAENNASPTNRTSGGRPILRGWSRQGALGFIRLCCLHSLGAGKLKEIIIDPIRYSGRARGTFSRSSRRLLRMVGLFVWPASNRANEKYSTPNFHRLFRTLRPRLISSVSWWVWQNRNLNRAAMVKSSVLHQELGPQSAIKCIKNMAPQMMVIHALFPIFNAHVRKLAGIAYSVNICRLRVLSVLCALTGHSWSRLAHGNY